MALQAVPLLREDSILAWEIESTFKSAPAAATWRALGRVEEWMDMGPRKAIFRDAIAGAGREAATVGVAGTSYGPTTFGPFQVVDPVFMGFAWGQETNAPVALGGGYYRHTASPTQAGRLPSFSLQMGDYKRGVLTDGMTYLGGIMPKLSIRGEEANEDGDAGRILMAPTITAHDDSIAVAGKGVTLPGSTPYFKQHANLTLWSGDADWRVSSWEFTMDNAAKAAYYHTNAYNGKPTESPPEGVQYDIKLGIVADGHTNGGRLLRDIVRDEIKGNAQLKYVRTANQDEWALNLTDVILQDATKSRRKGRIMYDCTGYVRASTLEWVDTSSTRFFPS